MAWELASHFQVIEIQQHTATLCLSKLKSIWTPETLIQLETYSGI